MATVIARLVGAGAATAAGAAALRAVEAGWRAVRQQDPPQGGRDPVDDAERRDMLVWAVVVTLAVTLASRVAQKQAEKLLGG